MRVRAEPATVPPASPPRIKVQLIKTKTNNKKRKKETSKNVSFCNKQAKDETGFSLCSVAFKAKVLLPAQMDKTED